MTFDAGIRKLFKAVLSEKSLPKKTTGTLIAVVLENAGHDDVEQVLEVAREYGVATVIQRVALPEDWWEIKRDA